MNISLWQIIKYSAYIAPKLFQSDKLGAVGGKSFKPRKISPEIVQIFNSVSKFYSLNNADKSTERRSYEEIAAAAFLGKIVHSPDRTAAAHEIPTICRQKVRNAEISALLLKDGTYPADILHHGIGIVENLLVQRLQNVFPAAANSDICLVYVSLFEPCKLLRFSHAEKLRNFSDTHTITPFA